MTTRSTKKPAKKAAKKTTKKPVIKKVVSTVKKAVKKAAKVITPEKIKNGGDKPTVTTTVFPPLTIPLGTISGDIPEGKEDVIAQFGVHAETAQAVEQKNEELIAEAKKHPLTFPEICSQAWEEVKGEGDPKFADCVPTHIEKFKSHAEAIINGGSAQQGDTHLALFEQAVARLK